MLTLLSLVLITLSMVELKIKIITVVSAEEGFYDRINKEAVITHFSDLTIGVFRTLTNT